MLEAHARAAGAVYVYEFRGKKLRQNDCPFNRVGYNRNRHGPLTDVFRTRIFPIDSDRLCRGHNISKIYNDDYIQFRIKGRGMTSGSRELRLFLGVLDFSFDANLRRYRFSKDVQFFSCAYA